MLKRKLFRELYKNKTQFAAIFLMAFLGIGIFFGFDSEATTLESMANTYYEQYRLADYWLSGKNFTEDDVVMARSVSGITDVERRTTLSAVIKDGNDSKITLHYIEGNQLNRFRVAEGEAFQEGASGIWLDVLYARAKNKNVGDTITIKIDQNEMTEEIKGLIYSPEYVYYIESAGAMYPDYGNYAFGYLSPQEFLLSEEEEEMAYTELLVSYEGNLSVGETQQLLEEIFPEEHIVVQDRKMQYGYETLRAESEQHHAMALMFSTIFLLIAILGIITTMARMTANQRIQIGTLKALGFSRGIITWHYMSFGFCISVLGSVLGAVFGYFVVTPFIYSIMLDYYILPETVYQTSLAGWIGIVVEIAISTLVCFLACRNELRHSPAETLRPKAPATQKLSWIERQPFWESFSFATQWNYRDIRRNPMRTFMGMLGIMGCTILLIAGFGLFDCMNYMTESMYHDINNAAYKISFESGTVYADAEEFAREYEGQMIEEGNVEFFTGRSRRSGTLTVLDKGNYMHCINQLGEEIPLIQDGIAISAKLAKQLGVAVGDFMTFRVVGEEDYITRRVGQIYVAYSGQGIMMTRDVYEEMEYSFTPTAILTGRSVPESLTDDVCVVNVTSMRQMKEELYSSMETMYVMIYILVFVAMLLGVIVLYNLGTLSYLEKKTEIATLKVIGFSTGRIRRILQLQNVWISMAGILVGIPAGYGFICMFCPMMSDDMDMLPKIQLTSYLIGVVGTFLVSVLVNQMLSGRVKKIDMVEALKGAD